MIRIYDKKYCCGCSACEQICPKHCIQMQADEEGFLYPFIKKSECIDCNLCEKVCPVINAGKKRTPVKTLAVKNPDEEIRLESSSGGVFSALAIKYLNEGGVVFGAKFNDKWEVVHDYIDKVDDLHLLQGSKYVQSRIGNAYHIAKKFLKEGRQVLFTGTPCQIAALKRFLHKSYSNLMTVDVICHGVPSPKIWQNYLDYLLTRKKIKGISSLNDISSISFRSKSSGWKRNSFQIIGGNGCVFNEFLDKNLFMRGFLYNLYLRPSCHTCPAKMGKSGSDITLGDYWGVSYHHPELDDDKGVSLVLLYNPDALTSIAGLHIVPSDYRYAVEGNKLIEQNVLIPPGRETFWHLYHNNGFGSLKKTLTAMQPSLLKRCINKMKRILKWN